MKFSIIASVVAAAINYFSEGKLGAFIYAAAAPVLQPFFGHINDWRGDDVLPAMIGAGMYWSMSFLLAGHVNRRLLMRGVSPAARMACYGAIVWLSAVLVWAFMASTADVDFNLG